MDYEFANGVKIETATDGVYIHDEDGEIVCWVADEWIEDPEVATIAINACLFAVQHGGHALRVRINHPSIR